MQTSPNKIYLKRSQFKTEEELNESIKEHLSLLIPNDTVCVVYKSPVDDNINIIEFASLDPALTTVVPMWLNPAEIQLINDYRKDSKDIGEDLTGFKGGYGDA